MRAYLLAKVWLFYKVRPHVMAHTFVTRGDVLVVEKFKPLILAFLGVPLPFLSRLPAFASNLKVARVREMNQDIVVVGQ